MFKAGQVFKNVETGATWKVVGSAGETVRMKTAIGFNKYSVKRFFAEDVFVDFVFIGTFN